MTRYAIAVWMALAALPAAWGVTCPTGITHVVDTLLLADGVTAARGTIAIRGPSAPAGSVVASTVRVTMASDGGVDFCLAGGPGWKYDATFALVDAATGRPTDEFTERWIVPATERLQTRKMLWGGSSAPQFLVSPQQINPEGLGAGQMWIRNSGNTAWVAGAVSGSGSGGLNPICTWSALEAGNCGAGSLTATMTWAEIEAL